MLNERGLKEAFDRVKEDIFNLSKETSIIKSDLTELKQLFSTLNDKLIGLELKQISFEHNCCSSSQKITPTHKELNPTHSSNPTDNPTVPHEIGGLKSQFSGFSIGNEGVPTDRQTNQQTDNPTDLMWNRRPKTSWKDASKDQNTLHEQIINATEILNSLDNLRKEIRLKFKAITNQEMLVFSTIYELEQNYPEGVEYEQIALKLKLSPSSIRDYVQRLITKGVPILKDKLNNKKILLKVSGELKKIATLDTIIKLREL